MRLKLKGVGKLPQGGELPQGELPQGGRLPQGGTDFPRGLRISHQNRKGYGI